MTIEETLELERRIDDALLVAGTEPPLAATIDRVLTRAEELYSGSYAVGIELLPYHVVGVLVDETGRRLGDAQQAVEKMEVSTVVQVISELTRQLVGEHLGELPTPNRVAIGLHLAGPVDASSGTVLFYGKNPPDGTPPFQWENVQLAAMIQSATELPTAIENDANSLALYQQWFGVGREVASFGLVLLRDGVGGSLVVDGRLFPGPFEIGNLVVYPEGGRRCDCGNQGCLEVMAGGYGITETGRIFTGRDVGSAAEVAQLVEDPSDVGAKALDAFRAAGTAIAKGLGFVVTLAAPPRVVLYAPPFMLDRPGRAAEAFLSEAEHYLRFVSHEAYRDCELVIAPLRPYEGAVAAAVVALERCLQLRPAHHGVTHTSE